MSREKLISLKNFVKFAKPTHSLPSIPLLGTYRWKAMLTPYIGQN